MYDPQKGVIRLSMVKRSSGGFPAMEREGSMTVRRD